jgi:hypothetical protein
MFCMKQNFTGCQNLITDVTITPQPIHGWTQTELHVWNTKWWNDVHKYIVLHLVCNNYISKYWLTLCFAGGGEALRDSERGFLFFSSRETERRLSAELLLLCKQINHILITVTVTIMLCFNGTSTFVHSILTYRGTITHTTWRTWTMLRRWSLAATSSWSSSWTPRI